MSNAVLRMAHAMPYDDAKQVAASNDVADRAVLAARTDAAPEILFFLAADPAAPVRMAVAANHNTPAQADHLLRTDADEGVRTALARKVARLAPGLSDDERERLRRLAYDTLSTLVGDTAAAVRAAIADAVKAMPDAPRGLILQLAHDTALPVAEPVLRFSPMLTEADLMGLVAAPPAEGTVAAIAHRPYLSEAIGDAIAASGDSVAITALLSNKSARIREATIDALIAQAAERTEYQPPLVRRPNLSPRAAAALAAIVTDTLLREMAARTDLDNATREALAEAVQRRLAPAPPVADPPRLQAENLNAEDAMAEARGMATRGELNEAKLLEAAASADLTRVSARLAAGSGVSFAMVERAASLRSAKALVSLCWKAGFSMKAAGAVQSLLGRVPPGKLLVAGPGGAFPLAPDEMRWQLDVLAKMGR